MARGAGCASSRFPAPVIAAREVNAQEYAGWQGIDCERSTGNESWAFQPRTFAVKLAKPAATLPMPQTQPITLPYDLAVANRDGERMKAGFDGEGYALPAEMLPPNISYAGTDFRPGSNGQSERVSGAWTEASSTARVRAGYTFLRRQRAAIRTLLFVLATNRVNVTIQDWSGFIGQWDNRQWKPS